MAQATMTLETKTRFQNALKEVRANGVRVRQNVMECCPGCITEKKLGMKDSSEAYAYTYGGQGQAYSWVDTVNDTVPVNRRDFNAYNKSMSSYGYRRVREPQPIDSIQFHWGNGSAEILVNAFKNNGFEAEWNGTDYMCVEVKFPN